MKLVTKIFASALLTLTYTSANAVTLLIGDVDGFGFANPNASYVNAQGGLPDTDGDGIIEPGEFLPNVGGGSAVNTQDIFDNRSAAEIAATNGAQYTDRSLQNATVSPHNTTFDFTFAVPNIGDLDFGVDHFINLVFGDYDVVPTFLLVDGTQVNLTAQSAAQDGLVQLAFANVAWADMLDGEVTITLLAPNEPYLAVDYAFLHTENTAAPVPAPATALLVVLGLMGLRSRLS